MKNYIVRLPKTEAERIRPQVFNMMNRIDPVIFRDYYGRMFVLVHGIKNKGFIGGMTESDLRKYVTEHSNVRTDEEIFIISCFSSTNPLTNDITMKYYAITEYPVFYGGLNVDEFCGTLFFSTIETSDEVKSFAKGLALSLSISEEEAEAIIMGNN